MSYKLEKRIIKQNKNYNFNGQLSSWSNSTSIIFPAQTWMGIRNTCGTFIFIVESITVAPSLFSPCPQSPGVHPTLGPSAGPQPLIQCTRCLHFDPFSRLVCWQPPPTADIVQGRSGPSHIQLVVTLEQCAHAPSSPKPGPVPRGEDDSTSKRQRQRDITTTDLRGSILCFLSIKDEEVEANAILGKSMEHFLFYCPRRPGLDVNLRESQQRPLS